MNKQPFYQILVTTLLLLNPLNGFAEDPFADFFEQAESTAATTSSSGSTDVSYELYDAALEQNTQTSLALINQRQAEVEKTLNQAAFNPQVSWETDAGYLYLSQDDKDLNVDQELNNSVVQTTISAEKVLWDRSLNLAVATSQQRINASKLSTISEQDDVRASVLMADLAVQEASASQALLQKKIQRLNELVNTVNRRKQLGYAAEIDVVEASTSLENARVQALTEQVQVDSTLVTLSEITGVSVDQLRQRGAYYQQLPAVITGATPPNLSVVLEKVYRNNAKLAVLSAEINAQNYQVRTVNAQTSAKVTLNSELEQTWSRGDTDSNTTDFTFGLNVVKPLYTGGRQAAQVTLAKQQRALVARRYHALKKQLTASARIAVSEYQSSLAAYHSLERLSQSIDRQINFTKAGVKFGSKSESDLISTLNSKFDVESNLVKQRFNLLKLKVTLAGLQGELS